MADPKDIFKRILEEGVRKIAPQASIGDVHIERPKNAEHGDLSTNVALQLSKQLGRKPREVAQDLVNATTGPLVASGITTQAGVSIAGPGFLNIKINPAFKLQAVHEALKQGGNYGRAKATSPQNIQVE